ncbi:MAG: OmpA family protein [Deltaproteobacteria bacterium]|nr:MAG: OmpA family protein [Deltaproteobacteria bacterium]
MTARILLSVATLACLAMPARASDLELGTVTNPGPDEQPALFVTPARAVRELEILVEAGGREWHFLEHGLPAGERQRFAWDRDPAVTHAVATIRAEFEDGAEEALSVPLDYVYSEPLSVDLSNAVADVDRRTLTVEVTAPVRRADIVATGAHNVVLDRRTVAVEGGPGPVKVPWVGDPADVVLLDVTLRTDASGEGGAWARFTYSPWFLDIPHDDVEFETDRAEIRPSEEPHLQRTLDQLHEVLDKYGDVVPVKLYIAGCTDTVGDRAHNRELSLARARSIATWLRTHGYDGPIYYWGFGEDLLAVPTADGVDEPRNRRALYMVGANPPPPSSGIPAVPWRAL